MNLSKKKPFIFFLIVCLFIYPIGYNNVSSINFDVNQTEVSIGIYNYPPFSFKEDDSIKGIFIDLIEYIGLKVNWKINYYFGNFSDIYNKTICNEIDIIPAVDYSFDTDNNLEFNNETVISTMGVVVTTSSEINSIFDLHHKRIGVVVDDPLYKSKNGIKDLLNEYKIESSFIEYQDYDDLVADLEDKNKLDAGVVNNLFYDDKLRNSKIRELDIIFNPLSLRFSSGKDNLNKYYLLGTIDQYLSELKQDKDSAYYDILRNYFETEENHLILFLKIFLGFAAIIISYFTFRIFNIKIKLKSRNKEIKVEKDKTNKMFSFLENSYDYLEILIDGLRNPIQVLVFETELNMSDNSLMKINLEKILTILNKIDTIFYSYVEKKKDK
ncbi:MAG: transporter substrate-binding domain-containing protein [Candidatus Heimdallarchaeum endolithica]|uniref:Transporter substrate-binding domain-containing protein n=1 Tax=Candidatus Heimdallarchaeum endolithica TaxID=2876572 RepID=A0A9Y1FP25_9ARCH|nr:MAG: transporter substrate-binding domain-containing protein [Candidatus Heimdallarchaeum endolithica]